MFNYFFETDIHFTHFKCWPLRIVGWFVSVLIEWICKYLCHRDPTELSVYKFDNLLIGEHTIQLYARHHTRAPRKIDWLIRPRPLFTKWTDVLP